MGDGKNARTKKKRGFNGFYPRAKNASPERFCAQVGAGRTTFGGFLRSVSAGYGSVQHHRTVSTHARKSLPKRHTKKSQAFKHLVDSEILQYSFTDFDLDKNHSKSLDYLMFRLAKQKRYFAAYLLISPDTIK